eukprot:COSAG02_NODE_1911_length_10408_cov_1015.930449_6_plen_1138_part_00
MPKTAELTTSRIVLFNAKNELLIVKETKRKKDLWNLPGGKREKGESLWECCRRECREETTIELPESEPKVCFTLRGRGKARVYVQKLEDCPDLTAFKPTSEIAECRWREPVNGDYNQPHDQYQLKEALDHTTDINMALKYKGCDDLLPVPPAKRQCVEATDSMNIDQAPTQSNDQPAPTQSSVNDQSAPTQSSVNDQPATTQSSVNDQPATTQSSVNDQPATTRSNVEKIDNELSALGLLWLQNMSYSEFAKLHTSNQCSHNDSDGTELKLASHFEQVRKFAKQFSEADFAELRKKATELSTEGIEDWEITQKLREVTVKREQRYNFARGRKSGRIFATNGGVQGFSKVVRAILTAHLTDLDMCNAHPTILLHLTKTQLKGFDPKCLQKYVTSREECLSELMSDDDLDREDAKTLFLKSANKDIAVNRVPNGKRKLKNKFFLAFDAEVKQIQQLLYDEHKNRIQIHDTCNMKGKLVNFLMCELEDELLRKKAFKAVEKLCEVQIPMFDGFMARTRDSDSVLKALNESTVDSDVRWDRKPHTKINFPSYDHICTAQTTMIGDLHSVATQLVQVLKVGRNGTAFVLWTHDNRLVFDVTPQKREFRDATINAMFQHDIHVACGTDKDGCTVYSCLKERTGLDVQMNIVRLIEQILPENNIEQEFWESEHSQKDLFCQGIEMWRTEVVYLSALNRCLHEIGNDDTEELQIHECHHLLSQKTHVTIEQYLSSSKCRRYVRDTFVPSLKYDGPDYNHYKGLAIQHEDCKDCSVDDAKPWIDHVRDIICNGDQRPFAWVMNFLAAPLQAIEKGDTDKVRQIAALFLVAGQGTGKGTFYHAPKTIYGSYYYPITKKSDLHDRFNEALFNSLFVELDECLFAGNHEQANEFKALVSESTGTKEEKMKKKRKGQKRWYNIGAATNSDHAAKIETDDRRNCILSPKEKNGGKPDLKWATHCRDVVQSDKCVRAVAKVLYEWPIPDDWHAQASIPETEARIDQKEQSLTPVESVVKTWLENERILPADTVMHNRKAVFGFGDYLPRAQVYKSAHEQFGRQRGFPQTQQSFFAALRRVFKKDSSVLEWVDNKKTFVYKVERYDDVDRNDGKETTERYIRIGTSAHQMQDWWNKNKYTFFKSRTLPGYGAS